MTVTRYSPEHPLAVGVVLFPGAEELDWAGPWEVWTTAGLDGSVQAHTVATTSDPVTSANGLRVLPDLTFGEAPAFDVVVVPGGLATRALVEDDAWIAQLRELTEETLWVTSVCTGALLLAQAGRLEGKRVTTHWIALEELAAYPSVEVVKGCRFVVDGHVVTSAGVSAGIDMSLWLVGEILGEEQGLATALFMEYDPQPPFDITAARGF